MSPLTALVPLVLIAVLGVSGVSKLLDLGAAADTMRALRLERIPPRSAVAAVAVMELAVAGGLALGIGGMLVTAATAGLVLMLGFFAVAVRAQRRHSTDDCGCFGRVARTRVGPWMTTRNAALVVLATLTLAGAALQPPAQTLAVRIAVDPIATAALTIAALSIALIGASFRAAPEVTPRPVVPPLSDAGAPVADAPLVAPDGTIVVPRQRALRGRAQLLLFVRRGCGSCERLIERVGTDVGPWEGIDVRLIEAVGDGGSPTPGGGLHVDPSGTFAEALGIPPQRPAGILLTTSGELLLPYAAGAEETDLLIDTVLAAVRGADAAEGL